MISNHFKTTIVKSECTVQQFQEKNDLKKNGSNVFIEYDDASENKLRDFTDVMLLDKVITYIMSHTCNVLFLIV